MDNKSALVWSGDGAVFRICNALADDRTRRSIWPRLALTADKTWMITTPVHYQRRSNIFRSGSLCRFTSFIAYPFLLLLSRAIIIIHLPQLCFMERLLLPVLMTIIITVINEWRGVSYPSLRSLTHSLARSFPEDRFFCLCCWLGLTEWLVYFLLQHSFSSSPPPPPAAHPIPTTRTAGHCKCHRSFSNNLKFPIINVRRRSSSSSFDPPRYLYAIFVL